MRQARKIVFLSIAYAPEITGNAAVITRLATALARRGHEVTVIAGTPHYGLVEPPARYRRKLFIDETIDGVQVLRCYAYPNSTGVVPKFFNYVTFTLTALLRGLRLGPHDLIVAVSPPLTLGLVLPFLRAKTRARTIYNVQDLWPEGYVISGVIKNRLVVGLLRWIERRVYAWSDRLLVITPHFRDALRRLGVPEGRLSVIPNFIDTEFIRPLPRQNDFARSLGLESRFVVLYAGNMGFTHDPGLVLEAAKLMRHLPDVRFLMVGKGSLKAALLERAHKEGLENVIFLNPVPDAQLPELMATADIAVYAGKRGAGRVSFPSRLYAFMAAGRPIAASLDPDSDAGRMLREGGCGLCTEPEQAESFVKALEQLYRDPGLRVELGAKGRRLAEDSYSLGSVVKQYEQVFSALLEGESTELDAKVKAAF